MAIRYLSHSSGRGAKHKYLRNNVGGGGGGDTGGDGTDVTWGIVTAVVLVTAVVVLPVVVVVIPVTATAAATAGDVFATVDILQSWKQERISYTHVYIYIYIYIYVRFDLSHCFVMVVVEEFPERILTDYL